MSPDLISILCDEDRWSWYYHIYITFKKDGIGELVCGGEHCWWIAAEIEWTLRKIAHFDFDDASDSVNIDDSIIDEIRNHPTPYLISQFEIEITMTRNIVPWLKSAMEKEKSRCRINDALLVEEAFRPKIYTVKLERGNFRGIWESFEEREYHPRFPLRLVFDKSPYPPREEWKKPDGKAASVKMWEFKEFDSREAPELKNVCK